MNIEKIRQQVLQKLGIPPNEFIQRITDSSITIPEPKNEGDNTKLQKVTIKDLPTEIKIWLLDFEMDIIGFRPTGRTVEKVLVTLENNTLTFYMIELKSHINHKTQPPKPTYLNTILDKFRDSISRIFFLLAFDNHHDWNEFKKLNIKFKGIVFYQKRIKPSINENTKIYEVINSPSQKGAVECENTFLGTQKIPVQFFENPTNTTAFEVSFQNM